MNKGLFATICIFLISLTGISQQETKVYIKSNDSLGRFYVYMDSVLLNRAPQIQVGIIDIEDKSSYSIRVVFQNHDRKPITGTIKPKKNKSRLYLLYAGTKNQMQSRKRSGLDQEQPIPGDIAPSHPAMPKYKGRLGCDFPIEPGVIDQTVSQMQIPQIRTPMEVATQTVTSYCVSVHEYRQILGAFESDSDRITLSKIAWYHIYDQENFDQLKDAFDDPTSMQTILSYVNENQ